MNAATWEMLIVEDQDSMRTALTEFFRKEGYHTREARGGEEAIRMIRRDHFDIILSDIRLSPPEGLTGLDILMVSKEVRPHTEVILMTAYGSLSDGIRAMKMGAYDYITKPFRLEEVFLLVQKALEKRTLTREVSRLKKELKYLFSFENIVGTSEKMQKVLNIVNQISPTDATVLITGESGTGKELVARAIHNLSLRREKPFVVVNCAVIPENLQESEIFGYVRGAFTGALRNKAGLVEEAAFGTLFLDEIGETSLSTQVKLLRFLDSGEIRRLGDTKSSFVDVRLIIATNRNLQKLIREKRFREDLFYRLNIITIAIPPLRERKEDIPLLAAHFLRNFNEKFGKSLKGISKEAMEFMMAGHWPGNVRELRNAMERAVALCNKDMIGMEDLPHSMERFRGEEERVEEEILPLKEIERRHIMRGIRMTGGDRTRLARSLGISSTTLWRKMKDYGIR